MKAKQSMAEAAAKTPNPLALAAQVRSGGGAHRTDRRDKQRERRESRRECRELER